MTCKLESLRVSPGEGGVTLELEPVEDFTGLGSCGRARWSEFIEASTAWIEKMNNG
jgi:hypothetical protein